MTSTMAIAGAGFVNITLSRVAPAHVRTEAFKISERGTLTMTAYFGVSTAMLLHFKKVIIDAARRVDHAIDRKSVV